MGEEAKMGLSRCSRFEMYTKYATIKQTFFVHQQFSKSCPPYFVSQLPCTLLAIRVETDGDGWRTIRDAWCPRNRESKFDLGAFHTIRHQKRKELDNPGSTVPSKR